MVSSRPATCEHSWFVQHHVLGLNPVVQDVLLEQVGFNLADRKDFVRDMILESRYVSATGPNTTEEPLQWDEYNPHSINELTRFCSSPEAQQEVAGEA